MAKPTGTSTPTIDELLSTLDLEATPELRQILNMAWDVHLQRVRATRSGGIGDALSRASCLFAAYSLDSDSRNLLEQFGFMEPLFRDEILLREYEPTPATIPPAVRANSGLVDALGRYASRFPERVSLDPIGLTYGCLATEKGRFITAVVNSGLDRLAAVREIESRFDLEQAETPKTESTQDPVESEEPAIANQSLDDSALETSPNTAQQQTPVKPQGIDSDDDEHASLPLDLATVSLYDALASRAAEDAIDQLAEGAQQANAFAEEAKISIDTVLLFAGLLLAPRLGAQREESWFVVLNELKSQFEFPSAAPEEVIGLRQHHASLDQAGRLIGVEARANSPVRKEVFFCVEQASEIALAVGYGEEPGIGVRHLLASLIWGREPRVRTHLQNTGKDLDRLRDTFYDWILREVPRLDENPRSWAQQLGIDPDVKRDINVVQDKDGDTVLPEGKSETRRRRPLLTVVNDPVGSDISPIAQFAGFAADTTEEQDDLLFIEDDVNAICAILAARDVPLPLSLGLFGDWGSGKTFFMNMMHDRIKLLADSSVNMKHDETAYCDKIIQIRFNAWHYIDANLWASLVTHILDELHAELKNDKTDPWQEAVKNLEAARGLHQEAIHGHKQAKTSVVDAEKALQDARNERLKKEREIKAKFSALTSVLAEEAKSELGNVVKELGLSESVSTVEELTKEVTELKSRGETLWGRLSGIAQSKYAVPYFTVLLLILFLSVGVGWLISNLAGDVGFWAEVRAFAGQLGTLVIGVAAWTRQPLKWLAAKLHKLEAIQKNAEAKKQQMLGAADSKPEAELAVLREKETAARENMRTAEKRLHIAEVALKEAQPSRRLYRLIEQRAESEDYRSRLGIISLIRNDFEKLAQLIRPPLKKSSAASAPDASESKEPKQNPIPIDRIVLYIDDLDRCPADRVVQVLEAVHLLLAFPIFVVVVAVDPRWLRRSLELTHPHLLTGLAAEGKANETGAHSGERVATPQNYLEKIFQVPFNLRPMGRVGFQNLVRKLVESRGQEDASRGTAGQSVGTNTGSRRPGSTRRDDDRSEKEEGTTPDLASSRDQEGTAGSGSEEQRSNSKEDDKNDKAKNVGAETKKEIRSGRNTAKITTQIKGTEIAADDAEQVQPKGGTERAGRTTKDKAPSINLRPPELELSRDEKAFMEELNLLFRTPRAVKRFVNTYRIFRVRAPGSDTEVFKGTTANFGEFRCAMVLLAILTGFPSLASKAIRILFQQPGDASWADVVDAFRASTVREEDFPTDELAPTMHEGRAEWQRMCEALEHLGARGALPFEAGQFRDWTPWIARYAFSDVLPAYREAE